MESSQAFYHGISEDGFRSKGAGKGQMFFFHVFFMFYFFIF